MTKTDDMYEELAGLLIKAATVIDSLSDVNSYCPFDTPAEFKACVQELSLKVRSREHAALRKLIPIFAPTGAWDDTVGAGGMELANQIMVLLDALRWNA